MSLTNGTRLGPYEILSPIGSGGMGEVYRARDTRLGRDVAVKVLPPIFSGDAGRLTRFEREARAVATLSHPNILAIYDVGEHEGVPFIVMELLEGETLRKRMAGGALPVPRATDWAVQIARGLAAAHEKGIVHRDLKPENIFVTNDGHLKILDFGLAKLTRPEEAGKGSQVPTGSLQTGAGTVLGTVGYMSPEQVRGQPADARSDIFALGIVLCEMLSGQRPFERGSAMDTLAAILKEPPPALPEALPQSLDRIVRRCLEKRPQDRFHSAQDLAFSLEAVSGASGTGSGLPPTMAEPPKTLRQHFGPRVLVGGVLGAVLMAACLAGGVVLLDRRGFFGSRKATMLSPTFQRLTTFDGVEAWPTLSPDGKTVAYQKSVGGKSDIYALRVGGKNPTNLTAGQEGDQGEPAFSPDGRFIAFRSESGGGGIFLMEATGESPKRLTDFGHDPAWFPDGRRIALTTEAGADPSGITSMSELWIVDLSSGARHKIPGVRAYQPSVSPHGLRIAYWGLQADSGGQRDIFTIGTETVSAGSPIAATSDAALDWTPFWSGDGRFLYFASDRGGTMNLWRVPIDEGSGKVHGNPEPVTVPASWAGSFRATPDASRIVFTSVERDATLERAPFDPATEKVSEVSVPLERFGDRLILMRVSPQGDLLTFMGTGSEKGLVTSGVDILVLKTDGTGLRKLTDDHFRNVVSSFSPDGRKIVFSSDRTGTFDLWIVNVDGSGLTPITRSATGSVTLSIWSPDGKTIAATDLAGHPLLLPFPRSADDPLPAPGPLPGAGLWFTPAAWSPDSKQLAGVIGRVDGSANGIIVYDVEKKTYRRVTETGAFPTFLGDGRRIAFLDRDVLKIVDPANGRVSEILKGDSRRTIDAFTLSPDNRSLFVSWASAQADLWLMDLGGKK